MPVPTPAPLGGLLAIFALALSLVACGDDDDRMMPGRDVPPAPGIARTLPSVAFEGQTLVVELPAGALDYSETVVAVDNDGPFELLEQTCIASRCAVVVRAPDRLPNTAQPLPAPIDNELGFLRLSSPLHGPLNGSVSVAPLDEISNPSSAANVGGVFLASSLNMGTDAVFNVNAGQPLRWIVFGEAQLAGTFNVSADAEGPGPGGFSGGDPSSAGEGSSGGQAAPEVGAGAGGGGNQEAGTSGDGADGTSMVGGAGGAEQPSGLACLSDLTSSECGGGGGGGSEGAGGHGGGSIALVSLQRLDLTGLRINGLGSDGGTNAGGGAGGHVLLAAPESVGDPSIDLAGGAGDGLGGEGAVGQHRRDLPASQSGLWVQPQAPVTMDAMVMLTGGGLPGAPVRVELAPGSAAPAGIVAEGQVATDGTFAVPVPLAGGLNRLALSFEVDGVWIRSFSGSNLQFAAAAGSPRPLPVGATVDIVRLAP